MRFPPTIAVLLASFGTLVACGQSRSHRAVIAQDGRFALPTLRLRRVADNTFILDFAAPPNAPRKAFISAICLDCLAGGQTPADAADAR